VAASGGAVLLASACGTVIGLDDLRYGPSASDAGGLADAPVGVVDDGSGGGNDGAADAALAADSGGPAPTTLVSGLGVDLGGLTVDGTTLYWIDQSGLVQSAPKTGGAATTISSGEAMPLDVAVDGQDLYWSVSEPIGAAGGAVVCNARFLSKAFLTATPTCATSTQYATLRMVLNDQDVVLLTHGAGTTLYVGTAAKATAFDAYKSATLGGPAAALAATNSLVYVGNANGHHVDQYVLPGVSSESITCLNGCGATTIVDMVLDTTQENVLWVTSDGNVYSAPVAVTNQTGTLVASLGAQPQRVARDPSHLYVSAANGSIYAVPLPAGASPATPLVLAAGEQTPFGIAVDSANVYWTAAGAIRAVPAPPP
jgi:hypothetical protein